VSIAAESTDLIIPANVTAAAGAACMPKPLKAEPPEEFGGEQAGRWRWRKRIGLLFFAMSTTLDRSTNDRTTQE
jgi:hypothetical protein